MKKYLYSLATLLCFCLFSCSPEEDDIFGQNSAERIDAAMKADLNVLTGATNGWHLAYYPASSMQYGGYNVLLKFTAEGEVTVAADITDPQATATSTFRLKEQAGPTLTFDTHNEIFHFFSDPKNSSGIGNTGLGMEGDFEFTILSATPDEVVLRGKKTGNRLVMTPLTDDVVWANLLTDVQKAEELLSRFVSYSYEDGDFTASVSPSYRNFNITYGEGDDEVTITAPYIITSEGNLQFYSPLELNGKVIEGLKYIEGEPYGQLVPTNDVAVTLTPLFPPTSFLMNGDWYFSRSGLGTGGTYWDSWYKAYYDQLGTTINFIAFTPDVNNELIFYTDVEGIGAAGLWFGVVPLSDSRVLFNFTGSGTELGVTLWQEFMFQYVCMPFMNKTFDITLDNSENPTVLTLTDVSNPSNTIQLSKEEVLDPFNN